MYCEAFLRDGISGWNVEQLSRYPAFESWGGIGQFKFRLARHFRAISSHNVFLASRSVELLRLAARLMFRTCRNVLTSDLNWPHWQAVVRDEAAGSGQQVTVAPIRDEIFNDHATADDAIDRLMAVFTANECDGLFLPAVNNMGVRIPLDAVLLKLKSTGQLRFAIVDAAQSFCHLPEPSPMQFADVTITGCHKWLRSSLPMGIAVCGRPLVTQQIQAILDSSESSDIDDPLLRFSEQICRRSVDRFSETVNIAPLFSANAAIHAQRTETTELSRYASRQMRNAEAIKCSAAGTSWDAVDVADSMRSGIVMMRSSSSMVRRADSEALRNRFREQGVALSAYPDGLIRLSAPLDELTGQSIGVLATAFARVA